KQKEGKDTIVTIIDYYDYGVNESYAQSEIWKKVVDVGDTLKKRIITVTEYRELGQLIYIQHEWKDKEIINGKPAAVTYKVIYEGDLSGDLSNAMKTVQRIWKEKIEHVKNPTNGEDIGSRIVTHIENYELGQKISDVYVWKNKENTRSGNSRLMTYTVMYELGISVPTSIQRTYYDKLGDYVGETGSSNVPRIIKVVEDYEAGMTEAVSLKYIYYDKRKTNDGINRMVQVTENRLPFGGADFIESIQYAYREIKDSIYTKDGASSQRKMVTIIETYEGRFTPGQDMAGALVTGIQWEYSIADLADKKIKKVTAYFEPGLAQPVSLQYTYKTTDIRAGETRLLTIVESYENNIFVSTQKIWKAVESVIDPITGVSQDSKVVTYRETYEFDMLVSVERSWRHFDAALKMISYGEIYEGYIGKDDIKNISGSYLASNSSLVRSSVQKIYKEPYKGRLATIVETYELNLTSPASIQKIYYDNVNTNQDGARIVKVIENWIQLGDKQYQQSMQYIYRKKDNVVIDPVTNETGEKYVTIIETYEGDFTESNGYVITQIQKDYSIVRFSRLTGPYVVRVSSYYDPGLTSMPTSIQFKFKRMAGHYQGELPSDWEQKSLINKIIWLANEWGITLPADWEDALVGYIG
ncbi:MAG: hypothetical protein CO035_04445, partial [Candidatus Omnitrophica bacterium CG_4_9_14_0_2_um_filter_42_8]